MLDRPPVIGDLIRQNDKCDFPRGDILRIVEILHNGLKVVVDSKARDCVRTFHKNPKTTHFLSDKQISDYYIYLDRTRLQVELNYYLKVHAEAVHKYQACMDKLP